MANGFCESVSKSCGRADHSFILYLEWPQNLDYVYIRCPTSSESFDVTFYDELSGCKPRLILASVFKFLFGSARKPNLNEHFALRDGR